LIVEIRARYMPIAWPLAFREEDKRVCAHEMLFFWHKDAGERREKKPVNRLCPAGN
jgi:hypothetical protein